MVSFVSVEDGGSYQSSSLVIFLDINGIVQFFEVIFLPPIFGGLELRQSLFGYKLSSSKISPGNWLEKRMMIASRIPLTIVSVGHEIRLDKV